MTSSYILITRDPSQDDGNIDPGGCKLMDSFGIFIQLCLATVAFSTLLIKRQREKPQRPLRIWSLDVSKQLVGGVVIHTLNVVAAYFFGVKPEQGEQSNPCVWYFLNILVDCTIGVAILWIILRGFKYLTDSVLQWPGFQSYGDPPLLQQLKRWVKQLFIYTISLMLMKTLVVLLFHVCPWMEDFGLWVLGWTAGNYKLQVAFVMLIFPLVMNTIQFWIIDTIVKHKDSTQIRLQHRDHEEEDDVENLLATMEEDIHDQRKQQSQRHGTIVESGLTTSLSSTSLRQKQQTMMEDERPLLAEHHPEQDTFDMDKEHAMEARQALDDHASFLPISTSPRDTNNMFELGLSKRHSIDHSN
ncbi:vacuolar membrane protein-domain-containing protein [Halteromyces radiatus]|uniref:vacuolar membrane protein-domain-containing protein n=1 Tax=Halteromyces radiatus TaxID=101107 RepID=UPI0022211431|nr:vacuolar membrane protein-domain-containing protein [Halteromyces radiatus]KAI8084899.1 vacuolar membrane protein-domain-containing protein [Halteromyces radiatus]